MPPCEDDLQQVAVALSVGSVLAPSMTSMPLTDQAFPSLVALLPTNSTSITTGRSAREDSDRAIMERSRDSCLEHVPSAYHQSADWTRSYPVRPSVKPAIRRAKAFDETSTISYRPYSRSSPAKHNRPTLKTETPEEATSPLAKLQDFLGSCENDPQDPDILRT